MQTSSSTAQPSRKPPGMEGKCMRCGKPEHQQGEKCAAKNAKCKECHKIGHFYKVCQSKKKTTRANLAQIAHQAEQDTYYNPQAKQDTYIDENGVRQLNPPMVNMLQIVNHIGTTSILGHYSFNKDFNIAHFIDKEFNYCQKSTDIMT